MFTHSVKGADLPPNLYEQEEKDMLKAWGEMLQALDQYNKKLSKDCFFSVRVKMMVKILHHISEENRLSKYDEKIFEYFQHLLRHYYEIIHLYEDSKDSIENGKIKEILEGVCVVLSAQLHQFEESQQQEYIGVDKRAAINPIKREKDQLITDTKLHVLMGIDEIEEKFNENSGRECSAFIRQAVLVDFAQDPHKGYIECLQFIYKKIIACYGEVLYTCYAQKAKSSIEKMNNLHLRKAARFYYESIKQEKENLEAIIKIQVRALEEEMKNTVVEQLEEQKIQQILLSIVEAYQRLGKEIEEMELLFKETENQDKKSTILTRETFLEYLQQEGMDKYIGEWASKEFPSDIAEYIDQWQSRQEDFYKLFEAYFQIGLQWMIDQKGEPSVYEEIEKEIQHKKQMTEEVTVLFESFIKYYKDHGSDYENSTYVDILKGIQETIIIKVESLQENGQSFFTSVEELFLQESKDTLQSMQQDQKGLYTSLMEGCIQNIIPLYLQDALYETHLKEIELPRLWEHELLGQILKKDVRQKQQKKEMFYKKILQFLREHLLFELTTYEEILQYSISRLRESDTASIEEYVYFVDQLTDSVEVLLTQYDIQVIRPNAHELFNGREHEVLLAEKQEGYQKGEIIKTVNAGYRYHDQMVLRANVIAAK